MKFKRTQNLEAGKLDMTPLIDVVFLLLIFFMLTSSFVLQPGIKVSLPEAQSAEVIHQHENIITLTKNKHIYFNEKLVLKDKLEQILAKIAKKSIIIQADGSVPLEEVVFVWDICRRVGIQDLNILTKPHKA